MKIDNITFYSFILKNKKMVAFISIHLFVFLSIKAADTYYQLSGTLAPFVAHHDYLVPLESNLYSMEYRLGFITDGSKEWHNAFNQPTYGIGISHGYFDSNYIGNMTSLFGFWSFPVYQTSKYLIGFNLSAGCAYVTNIFNEETNPLNRAISAHWNVDLDFSYSFEYYLSSNWSANGSLGLHHLSNGATKKPNSGINLLYPRVGVKYYPNEHQRISSQSTELPFFKTHFLDFRVGYSQKQIDNYEHNYFECYNASIAWQFDVSSRCFTGIGFDLIYDESLIKKGVVVSEERNGLYQTGIFGTYGWRLGVFSIYEQVGLYLWHRYDKKEFYNRLGCKYFISDWCYLNISLRSQVARAENIEFGIGLKPRLWKQQQ